jgi:rhamnosyltransferase
LTVRTRPRSVAAGIVAFRPEPRQLERLLAALLPQADLLLVYRNSPLPDSCSALAREHPSRIELVGDCRNLGLGIAYNRIVEAALVRGVERVLLLDQDSLPPPDLCAALAARMQGLSDAGERPAVAGPCPVSEDGRLYKLPSRARPGEAKPRGGTIPLQFVISSGSLIDAAAFRAVGPFREDFFIDAIDVEWCLRARSRGYTCWMAADLPMPHRLGSGVVRLPVSGMHLVRQPATRAYTFVRNQLALLRLGHVPPAWKARAMVRLVLYTAGHALYAPHRRTALRLLARGWRDGLSGRLGPPGSEEHAGPLAAE